MDRLQTAIEKAREQRAEVLKERANNGPLTDVGFLPETVEQLPSRDEIWQGLQSVDMNARALKDLRLMSNQGASQAVPYDLLRTRVLHQARQNGWRHIGIVSPTAACGKTTAAANLAFAFSHQPEVHMLLLDLDLRRPRLAGMMGQKIETGMEDVLLGRVPFADHARRLGNNVAIGFNNGPSDRPSELLQSAQTEERIAEITEQFDPDLVLIDLPPMMSTDDNFGFLSKVDAVLLMVAAEESTTEQIEVALRQLGELTTVMGIVLNKCRHTGGAYGYDNKYYYS
ncbi:nucleotide-binding protein [Aliiruegeria sabulilitoris]|uniref:nucleotide-binding protein n=1 Tax=Aliiruegeria sabulilitoris TaxID=1510458 RepID=UPI0008356AFE|nr:tyrosine-protein kinase family protein [Aliiruegeria sabulilitoris]NDR57068.1 tyrosine-protein kinase family protein [Pseudoruegeria sp. M32A2M]